MLSGDLSLIMVGMFDIHAFVVGKLNAETRSLKALKKIIGVPSETLRDIRTGHIKSPGIATLQKIAAHYQLPQRACQKNRNVKEAHV